MSRPEAASVLAVAIDDEEAREGWRVDVSWREIDAGLHVLSADEHARCDAMTANTAAQLRRAAHAFKREVLAAHLGMAPEDLAFLPGAGPPRLMAPHDATRVSLSHTHGAVAVTVAVSGHPVGVDIETIDRGDDVIRLAPRYFAPAEARLIGALDAPQFEFAWRWTAKEALLKARGLKLGEALATHMGDDLRERNALPFTVHVGGAHITVFSPADGYVCAVAKA